LGRSCKNSRFVAATGHHSESLQVVESCGENRFSEIPLIAFLIFEESYFPLKRGISERLIFEEPNLFEVERFSRAAGRPVVKEKHLSEIPLIAFLIFEESYFPLKRGMGERLIFEEPNLFEVERFSRAAGVPRCAGQNLDVESWHGKIL
jgi:hypothetical protein